MAGTGQPWAAGARGGGGWPGASHVAGSTNATGCPPAGGATGGGLGGPGCQSLGMAKGSGGGEGRPEGTAGQASGVGGAAGGAIGAGPTGSMGQSPGLGRGAVDAPSGGPGAGAGPSAGDGAGPPGSARCERRACQSGSPEKGAGDAGTVGLGAATGAGSCGVGGAGGVTTPRGGSRSAGVLGRRATRRQRWPSHQKRRSALSGAPGGGPGCCWPYPPPDSLIRARSISAARATRTKLPTRPGHGARPPALRGPDRARPRPRDPGRSGQGARILSELAKLVKFGGGSSAETTPTSKSEWPSRITRYSTYSLLAEIRASTDGKPW